jgi:aldose 1-epimerase
MRQFALAMLLPLVSGAAEYTASRASVDGVEVVRLSDPSHRTEVSIAASIGNIAYEMKVNGKNVLYVPFQSLSEFKAKPTLAGNPLLAPWANRIDQLAYFVNGRKYLLNANLNNFVLLSRDQIPNHGLVAFSPHWELSVLEADNHSAWMTSRLEYWRFPDLMAQFPFAHTLEVTYRLANGVLEVETSVTNHSKEEMPVVIGYHTYYQLDDAPRDQWRVHIPAKEHLMVNKQLLPTGESKAMDLADPLTLADLHLDDLFTELTRGADGRAQFSVQGTKQKITVSYGAKYTGTVVYAPRGRAFICFEPMAAITNAFNLAHAGVYKALQSLPPGGQWRESFWIAPSGF